MYLTELGVKFRRYLLAEFAAIVGGILCVWLLTWDLETMAIGAIAGALLIPSVLLYGGLHYFAPGRWFKDAAYWLSSLALVAFFLSVAWLDSMNEVSDGSGAMAQLIGLGVFVASLAGYFILRKTE